MKELSREENTKNIDVVKQMVADGQISQDVAEKYFPELKELSDEKIREALIHLISEQDGFLTTINGINVKDILVWLEKGGNQIPLQANERTWLYLVADVLTWKDGIGQYLDNPRVQELAKKLCSEYSQKLYNSTVISKSSQNEKISFPTFTFDDIIALQCCMETAKKVQGDKDLYEKLNNLHNKVYDAYYLGKQGEQKPINYSKQYVDYHKDSETQMPRLTEFENELASILFNREYEGSTETDDDIAKGRLEYELAAIRLSPKLISIAQRGNEKEIPNSEQKSTEFKIEKGNWYVCIRDLLDNYANKVFCKGDIYLSTQEGSLIPSNNNAPYKITCCPDTYFRNWTIQDARNGDVLASDNGVIILVKESRNSSWGYRLSYHCAVLCDDKFEPREFHVDPTKFLPATKKQRDTLFKKMYEAGYTFDFEKKELKEIDEEYNGEDYGIDGLYHAQRILEKTLGKVEGYQTDDGILSHQCAISAIKKLYKQKPTQWSKDDAMRLQRIVDFLWNNRKGDTDTIYQQEQDINWLKSIKDRMQHQ